MSELTVKIQNAQGSNDALEKLITEYQSFILACASRTVNHFVTKSDDEWSVALIAFNEAVDKRLAQKNCLVIYPEAHVWPYYTGIRKFPAGDKSFKYAVRNKLPIFTMTTT